MYQLFKAKGHQIQCFNFIFSKTDCLIFSISFVVTPELKSSTALFLSRKQVSTKVYSPTSTTERVTLMENELKPEEIKGFITCMYNEEWWVACILQVSGTVNKYVSAFSILMDHHDHSNIQPD